MSLWKGRIEIKGYFKDFCYRLPFVNYESLLWHLCRLSESSSKVLLAHFSQAFGVPHPWIFLEVYSVRRTQVFKNWLLVVIMEENVLKKSDDFLDIKYLTLNHSGGVEFGGRKRAMCLSHLPQKRPKMGLNTCYPHKSHK